MHNLKFIALKFIVAELKIEKMAKQDLRLSEFELKGKFLGFFRNKSGKLKHLRLLIAAGDVKIKVPKKLRNAASLYLVPGEEISIRGVSKRKINKNHNKVKLKAKFIKSANFFPKQNIEEHSKAKILICQKPRCIKRGGKNLVSKLEKTLCQEGLQDQVTIKRSGCLKRCSKAPNCVLEMSAKKSSDNHPVHPKKIISLLEKYVINA